MHNQEARFILSAYRPSGEDAADPRFAEALEQARRDAELAALFAGQRTVDVAVSEALLATAIPPELRGNILAGGSISRRRFWPRRRSLAALAAAVVLLAVLLGVLTRQSRLETWQKDALATIPTILTGQSRFDHEANDGRALQEWLQAQHAPAPDALPASLQTLPALGCKTISSGGKQVSIICFKLHGDEMIHLIVTDGTGLSHMPPQEPRFVKQDGWITASWTQNGRACMLATKASERELREVLATKAQASNNHPLVETKI